MPSESTATVRLATVGTVVLTLGQLCAILTLKGVSTMADKNRVNNHNSRKGTNGKAINARHHDRDFDINSEYAEHIDNNRVSLNVYKWYQTVEKECATFDEYEQAFYEENFNECLQARNEKAIKGRQPKRVQTMEQYRHNLKACPEESIFTLSNAKNPVSTDVFQSVFDDFIAWHIETFPNCKVLDSAIHLDEANPHAHWRKVWTAHEGEMLVIGQEKALKEMGIDRPNLTEKKSRTNNAKVTYTKMCREKQIELAKKYGIEVEEIAQEPTKNGKTLIRYQMDCLIEEKEGLQNQVNELNEQVEQLTTEKEGLQKQANELTEQVEQLTTENDKLRRQALEYEFEPKSKSETQSHYDKRRALHELKVGVEHTEKENAREAQNIANARKQLDLDREIFEEQKRNEEKRLHEEKEESARKKANIDAEITNAARELNKDLLDKVDELTERIANQSDTIEYYKEQKQLDRQEIADLKDRIDELENPHQSYGYGLKM